MIHPSSIVSPKAKLGNNVEIGPFTIIHDNVEIGANSFIGSHCEIGVPTKLGDGSPLKLGESALIRSHSVFYESSNIGDNFVTGHRVTVRECAQIGKDFQMGTLGDIQGHCEIGDYVRANSNVHIARKTKIGNFVWIFPYTIFTNDPHPPSSTLIGCVVEDYAVITTMCVLLPGVHIGTKSLVAAHSLVSKDVEAETRPLGSV